MVVGWMVLRVGTVGRLTVRRKFRVRLMVMIVMHVGAVGRLIVLGMLIVRGRLPRLWVLLLAGMWRLDKLVCELVRERKFAHV